MFTYVTTAVTLQRTRISFFYSYKLTFILFLHLFTCVIFYITFIVKVRIILVKARRCLRCIVRNIFWIYNVWEKIQGTVKPIDVWHFIPLSILKKRKMIRINKLNWKKKLTTVNFDMEEWSKILCLTYIWRSWSGCIVHMYVTTCWFSRKICAKYCFSL